MWYLVTSLASIILTLVGVIVWGKWYKKRVERDISKKVKNAKIEWDKAIERDKEEVILQQYHKDVPSC